MNRKKVPFNPNYAFANIDKTMRAKGTSAMLEAQEATRNPLFDPEQVSKAIQESSLQELQPE